MVQKKTFIITIIAIVVAFIAILASCMVYHFQKIEEIKKEKGNIMILPENEQTGLTNIVAQ